MFLKMTKEGCKKTQKIAIKTIVIEDLKKIIELIKSDEYDKINDEYLTRDEGSPYIIFNIEFPNKDVYYASLYEILEFLKNN